MKEINIEDITIVKKLDKNITRIENVTVEFFEDYYKINFYDPESPLEVMQNVNLNENFSNLKTVNKILAIFDYKIVNPLIDFSKPLEQELRRLCQEDELNYTSVRKCYMVYDEDDDMFIFFNRSYSYVIGAIVFQIEKAEEIKKFLNDNKEKAKKAMEL